jgi:hypothetical protein
MNIAELKKTQNIIGKTKLQKSKLTSVQLLSVLFHILSSVLKGITHH